MKNIFSLILFSVLSLNAQKVKINPDFKSGNEPSLAINPKNNAQVVLAFNNNHVFKSKDTGNTFKRIKVNSKHGFYGDPVLHWGAKNDVFLLHLSKNPQLNWPESFDRIVFQKLNYKRKKHKKSVGIGYNTGKMQDKPWIHWDKIRNRIHVSWTEFDQYGSKSPLDSSRIMHAYSNNNGKTFSKPKSLSKINGNALDGDSTMEGATITSDQFGNTYCTWSGMNKIWFCMSKDGGETWNTPSPIENHNNGWDINQNGIMRANGMPFLTHINKKLILVWAEENNGFSMIHYKFYNIEYQEWEATKTLLSFDKQTNFVMPYLEVKGDDVFLIYYGITPTGFDSISQNIKVYVTRINETQTDFAVAIPLHETEFTSKGKPFLGDYLAISPLNLSKEKEVLIAYTTLVDNRHTYIVVKKVNFNLLEIKR